MSPFITDRDDQIIDVVARLEAAGVAPIEAVIVKRGRALGYWTTGYLRKQLVALVLSGRLTRHWDGDAGSGSAFVYGSTDDRA